MDLASEGCSRAWVEVCLGAVRSNLRTMQEWAGGAASIAVVKADAYGHGLERVCQALASETQMFGVAALGEAAVIQRTLGEDAPPILLMGATLADEMETAVQQGWHLSVSTVEELAQLGVLARRLDRTAAVHLIVDTGMGRIGALENEFLDLCQAARRTSHIAVRGLASHLPSADEDVAYTESQIGRFAALMTEASGLFPDRPPAVHLHNSAGIFRFPPTQRCLVRPGLAMYGVSPEVEFQERLKPAMTLKTRVRLVRDLPAGHGISYGRTFLTQRATRVATLGIGYGDGYRRSLSGQGVSVLIHGQRCALLGRVTMDQIMVDVTDVPHRVRPGDEVVVFGQQGDAAITVREISEKAGTIAWEILTGISKRVPRVYHEA